jgi:hypothetical protein
MNIVGKTSKAILLYYEPYFVLALEHTVLCNLTVSPCYSENNASICFVYDSQEVTAQLPRGPVSIFGVEVGRHPRHKADSRI